MGQVRSASELPAPPKVKLRRTEVGGKNDASQKNSESKYDSPDQLRRIIEAHKNMAASSANVDKHAYLGALKYLPHAVFKILENMPAPWEATKEVEVLYHKTGAITFVNEIPKVDPRVYAAQWGQIWTQMREEKRDRTSFRRMRIPAFDDEEPFMSYPQLARLVPEAPEAIPLEKIESLFEALEYSLPFRMDRDPPTMFDMPAFRASKELDIQLPNGPKFEHHDGADGGFSGVPSAYDDPQRIVYRPRQTPVRVEAQVAFPRLYGASVEDAGNNREEPRYLFPISATVKRHDNQKGLFIDQSVTRVLNTDESMQMEDDPEVLPFLADQSLNEQALARSMACYEARFPFNRQSNVRKRAQDVSLVKPLYTNRRPLRVMLTKTRRSYQRLLKRSVKRTLQAAKTRRAQPSRHPSLLKSLGATKFFGCTKVDWLEAAMQLITQGFQILQLLIHRRGLHFMHLDYNFNLKPTKTLTTKERKRSRFGNSFHLIRELLKIVKLIVDCHVQFRIGNVDSYELNDGIHYILTHIGQLTGLYRYKYKVMHQITATNDLKHLIYDRFNGDGVGKGPGCGVWQPAWCVWLGFLRGNLPMLERWLGNLIQRQFFGRVSKGVAKTVTKQRIDSAYDLELRAAVLHDILDVIPEQLRKSKTKVVMQHLSEAWRCWKANVPWDVPGMPAPVKQVIIRYIQARADHWTKVTQVNRERIRHGKVADKAVARKNLGRITRLWLREEQQRQQSYVLRGPFLQAENAVIMYKTLAGFLKATGFTSVIEFPATDYPHDTKLLTLALETLKGEFNMASRLSNTQRDQLALIEAAYDNPYETLLQIKTKLASQRVFKDVEVSLLDFFSHLTPVYHVDMAERIIDSYLDQYLWYEATRKKLFPSWIKPVDNDVAPIMVRKFCNKVNEIPDLWSTENDAASSLIHLKLDTFVENVDLTLLNQLLKLVVDPLIADYITAKMNASLVFKDMSHINQFGVLRGFAFSSFVVQYYLMMVDVLLLGNPQAIEMHNREMHGSNVPENDHPIRSYMRYFNDVYVVFHLTRDDAEDIVNTHIDSLDFDVPIKSCWSHDRMMRLIRRDVLLGKALFEELNSRLPEDLGTVKCLDASVYSVDNPALLFDMAGFEIRLIPKFRLQEEVGDDPTNSLSSEDALWSLINSKTDERSGYAFLMVNADSIMKFNNRVRQILMSSGSTTFAKIAKRWNTTLTATAAYFREAAVATPELLEGFVKGEVRIQNKIKMGLNSKMPARFPPCVFYSPEEIGGLGMLSASHIIIPETDLRGNTTRYKFGMSEADDAFIPNIFRYINSWEAEATDSYTVWQEYVQKRNIATEENSRILAEDLEEIWDRGLPRISTLFQKDRSILAFDKGFRCRQEYMNFGNDHFDPFWWTNSRHDGRLWNFNSYRADVIQALGGIQSILSHTLFKATGFEDWEGLFWQKQSGFEQQMQMQKLTNAQRSGLSQIPNRRFTLWWSPTINRGNVYVGFMVQLDLTGIFLHGKIPTLKISYIQIFRAHLWQKIHESLIISLCTIFDNEQSVLGIDSVAKLPIHPRKSYRMNASTADISLTCSNGASTGWPISRPSAMSHDNDDFAFSSSSEFWIDVQLRYGDFDSSDISRFTKAKYLDYTNDGVSSYPSKTGLMVCFDLAYNTCDAYGNWFPGLKQLVRQGLSKILQSNPALFILRERIRKALQLHQSQPNKPHLSASDFTELVDTSNLILDDSAVYRVTTHRTKHGNMASKAVNGALFGFRPVSGDLIMSIVHADSAWAGQKKLGAVSKWKSAELTAEYFRKITSSEIPEKVIISTRGLRDPLEVNMLEFSNVSVINSEMVFPFQALLNLSKFRDLVDNAQESKLQTDINLYDDWLTISQPTTAFSRLMLILRALLVNPVKAENLFRRYPEENNYIWPKLSPADWIDVENELSDLVVEAYGEGNDVDTRTLTQTEIRDIILGQKIGPVSEERQLEALDQSNNQSSAPALVTESHNVHGDRISVVTTSKYERATFNSQNNWRDRALQANATLHYRASNLSVAPVEVIGARSVTISKSLVQQFVTICDVRNLVLGLLYGDGDRIMSIAMVPQIGSGTAVTFAQIPTYLPDSQSMQLMGIIRSEPTARPEKGISPVDLTMLGGRSDTNLSHLLVLTVSFTSTSTSSIRAFEATEAGLLWGRGNKDLLSAEPKGYLQEFGQECELKFEKRLGFFYVPENDLWNYSFLAALWNANRSRVLMKIDLPRTYYDFVHRSLHFKAAVDSNDTYDADYEYGME